MGFSEAKCFLHSALHDISIQFDYVVTWQLNSASTWNSSNPFSSADTRRQAQLRQRNQILFGSNTAFEPTHFVEKEQQQKKEPQNWTRPVFSLRRWWLTECSCAPCTPDWDRLLICLLLIQEHFVPRFQGRAKCCPFRRQKRKKRFCSESIPLRHNVCTHVIFLSGIQIHIVCWLNSPPWHIVREILDVKLWMRHTLFYFQEITQNVACIPQETQHWWSFSVDPAS